MPIEKIAPDLELWTDPGYMKLVKKLNELIAAEDRDFKMILNIRNDIQDLRKSIDELKRAVRNY
ncbi:MAG: hypothetical protein ACW99F_14420 [Candidatus Hodarchaeales archaeon]|jgi:hypothetical protein